MAYLESRDAKALRAVGYASKWCDSKAALRSLCVTLREQRKSIVEKKDKVKEKCRQTK